MAGKEDFIAEATKRKGRLKGKAKRAGELTGAGTIKKSFIRKSAKAPGELGKEARLALTLGKLRPRKK